MKAFISWSGTRSKALAIHLHEWLRTVVQRAEPWMSDRDIEAGQRWNEELAGRLKATEFGIICLTPENLNAPWLLFEAGALAKAVDSSRVVPVLLAVRKADLTFPLAQFQAIEADREGFFALASAVNRALGDQQLSATVLNNIFSGLWAGMESKLRVLLEAPGPQGSRVQRSEREVLEDVLESVRTIQQTIGSSARTGRTYDLRSWEDSYIRGVNLANTRGGPEANIEALRSYSEAIAVAPPDLDHNTLSRLYAYRGAIFKRLGRLDEAEHDLLLARTWAREDREAEDALYNMACVKAMKGEADEALRLLRELFARDRSWVQIVSNKKQYFKNLANNRDYSALMRAPA